ncbi:MAG: hypothetical protein U0166_18750 [Acidobacteriota bacterium]
MTLPRSTARGPAIRCAALASSVALMLGLGCGGRGASDARDAAGSGKPRLELHASAASGFIPLNVELYGQMSGVAGDDVAFADPGERWIERTATGIDNKTEREPGEGRARSDVPRLTFEKTVFLDYPGTYRYQLMVKSSDGREVWSNWVTVRALYKQ